MMLVGSRIDINMVNRLVLFGAGDRMLLAILRGVFFLAIKGQA